MIPANTKNSGSARIFIFPEKHGYTAICLDFGVLGFGETLEEAEKDIKDAVIGHLETVRENNLPDYLLNRPAPEEYWKKFEAYQKSVLSGKAGRASRSTRNSAFISLPIRSLSTA